MGLLLIPSLNGYGKVQTSPSYALLRTPLDFTAFTNRCDTKRKK